MATWGGWDRKWDLNPGLGWLQSTRSGSLFFLVAQPLSLSLVPHLLRPPHLLAAPSPCGLPISAGPCPLRDAVCTPAPSVIATVFSSPSSHPSPRLPPCLRPVLLLPAPTPCPSHLSKLPLLSAVACLPPLFLRLKGEPSLCCLRAPSPTSQVTQVGGRTRTQTLGPDTGSRALLTAHSPSVECWSDRTHPEGLRQGTGKLRWGRWPRRSRPAGSGC